MNDYKDYLDVIAQINQKFEQFRLLVSQEMKEVNNYEAFQLTPQQEMIMFYIIRRQPIIANDIATYLKISKSAVSQVISKLEEKRMIQRQINPANRRESLIFLGAQGEKFQQLLKQIDEKLVRKYYSKVSIKELNAVLQTLDKIITLGELRWERNQ